MLSGEFYPDVRIGDRVEFCTDPHQPADGWRLGEVRAVKVRSADLIVYSDLGPEYRHDCLHIDDPKIKSTRDWAQRGRGIFRLARSTIEERQRFERLASIEMILSQLDAIENKLAYIEQRMDQGAMSRAGRRQQTVGV